MSKMGLAQLTTAKALAAEIRATAVIAKTAAIEVGNTDEELRWVKCIVLATQLHAMLRTFEQHDGIDRCLPFHGLVSRACVN